MEQRATLQSAPSWCPPRARLSQSRASTVDFYAFLVTQPSIKRRFPLFHVQKTTQSSVFTCICLSLSILSASRGFLWGLPMAEKHSQQDEQLSNEQFEALKAVRSLRWLRIVCEIGSCRCSLGCAHTPSDNCLFTLARVALRNLLDVLCRSLGLCLV